MASEVKTLTDATFDTEVADTGTPMIVDFWAPWCGPCRMVGPVIDEIAQEHADKVSVGKVNVDENPATAQKYGIMSIPTIILFKDGEPAKKVIGARSKADFLREFELA
ncbi:MAG TPA: thioredoxin [Thermoleophilia bacterium]|nr:thioredoxin [Thermoleophilia bacterium]